MLRGLYSAASSLLAQMARQDLVANNLANLQTVGYRADTLLFQPARALPVTAAFGTLVGTFHRPVGQVGTGVLPAVPQPDLRQGPLRPGTHPLDLALVGPGFFAVQTPDGQVAYTRAGVFRPDATGTLTTPSGDLVLGADGQPIVLPPDGEVRVEPDGTLLVAGTPVGRLQVVDFPPGTPLRKQGRNLLVPADPATPPAPAPTTTVLQGYLEGANVDLPGTFATMLSALRAFEASQRLIQWQDQVLERTVSELGRV